MLLCCCNRQATNHSKPYCGIAWPSFFVCVCKCNLFQVLCPFLSNFISLIRKRGLPVSLLCVFSPSSLWTNRLLLVNFMRRNSRSSNKLQHVYLWCRKVADKLLASATLFYLTYGSHLHNVHCKAYASLKHLNGCKPCTFLTQHVLSPNW